jgi:hypothetical protein
MDGHPFLFHRFMISGAFSLQTTGTPLLAVARCSLARMRMGAQVHCCAPGLLYFSAYDWYDSSAGQLAHLED